MSRVSKFGVGVVSSGLALGLALNLEFAMMARATECQPPTPCPCAADGTCYPKRQTWGNYKTNWRPWPGEQVGLAPTKAEETKSNIREQLPSYQAPRPDQEDLRGPAKKTRIPGAVKDAPAQGNPQPLPNAEGAVPGENEIELPGLPGLPGFDPQGSVPIKGSTVITQVAPPIDDAPPALPQGLSKSLETTPLNQAQQVPTGPTVVANRGRTSSILTDASVIQTAAEFRPTSKIQLINPAAQHIYQATDKELHQALFIEASDTSVGAK